MVEPVDPLAQAFAEAGADVISFHPDASTHVDRTLQLIRAAGCQAGLVFNPAASLDVLDWVIDKVDLVLVMSLTRFQHGVALRPTAAASCWTVWRESRCSSARRARSLSSRTYIFYFGDSRKEILRVAHGAAGAGEAEG